MEKNTYGCLVLYNTFNDFTTPSIQFPRTPLLPTFLSNKCIYRFNLMTKIWIRRPTFCFKGSVNSTKLIFVKRAFECLV